MARIEMLAECGCSGRCKKPPYTCPATEHFERLHPKTKATLRAMNEDDFMALVMRCGVDEVDARIRSRHGEHRIVHPWWWRKIAAGAMTAFHPYGLEVVRATFCPLRRDDLKEQVLPLIGRRGVFKALWEITEDDGGSYVGQWAMETPREWQRTMRGLVFWVPSGDLVEIERIGVSIDLAKAFDAGILV